MLFKPLHFTHACVFNKKNWNATYLELKCLALPVLVYLSSPRNAGLDLKQTTTYCLFWQSFILELTMLLAQSPPHARINVLPPHSSSSSIKKMYFSLVCGCASAWVCTWGRCLCRSEEVTGSHRAGVTDGCRADMMVRTCARITHALNYCTPSCPSSVTFSRD